MSPYPEDCNFSFTCELASSALLGWAVFSSLVTMTHMLLQTRTTPHLPAVALLLLLYFQFSPVPPAPCSIPHGLPSQRPLCLLTTASFTLPRCSIPRVSHRCCLQSPCAQLSVARQVPPSALCECTDILSPVLRLAQEAVWWGSCCSGVLSCAFIAGAGCPLLSWS